MNSAPVDRQTAGRRLLRHARDSLPSLREAFFGAVLWGAAMAISMEAGIWLRNRAISGKTEGMLLIFFAGAAFAWPFIFFLVSFASRGRHAALRLLTAVTLIALGTASMTAFLFSQQYRHYYAQWHEHFLSIVWAYQFTGTTIAAVYQFMVMGLGLYFPLGYLFVAAASLWLMQRLR
jgi:hypothetical protein